LAVASLDRQLVPRLQAGEKAKVGIAVAAHHRVAPVAGQGRAGQVAGTEGQSPAAGPREDHEIDVLAGHEQPGHRLRVRPGPRARVALSGPGGVPRAQDQVLGEAGLGLDVQALSSLPRPEAQ
jgi:hypothetical protein